MTARRPANAAEGGLPVGDSPWRRYSEFELLRTYLLVTYPFVVIPPLPEKRVSGGWRQGGRERLIVFVSFLVLVLFLMFFNRIFSLNIYLFKIAK